MADKKITDLDATLSVALTDLLAVVVNPGTTPVTKKIIVDNLKNSISSSTRDLNVIVRTNSTGYLDQWLTNTGWIEETVQWTYASATTFTVSGDVRSKFPVGTKLKLTQTTVKYFYVISTSYSAPNTTVTVTGGNDYSLANAAITSPYYSYASSPQSFPQWFHYTPTVTGSGAMTVSSLVVDYALFAINGRTLSVQTGCTFTTGGTADTVINCTLPVGVSYVTQLSLSVWVRSTVYITGWASFSPPSTISIRRYDAANWTLAAGNSFQFSGVYPV